MIDKKYKRNKLFKVGQIVKISRDLSSFYSVHDATTENLEKFFHLYNSGSKYFEALFVGVSDKMASKAGNIDIVSVLGISNNGFNHVKLEVDNKRWMWTYDMFEPYFEPVVIYETISGLKLELSECGDFLINGKTKIKVSDYNLFHEHKNIKSLSII